MQGWCIVSKCQAPIPRNSTLGACRNLAHVVPAMHVVTRADICRRLHMDSKQEPHKGVVDETLDAMANWKQVNRSIVTDGTYAAFLGSSYFAYLPLKGKFGELVYTGKETAVIERKTRAWMESFTGFAAFCPVFIWYFLGVPFLKAVPIVGFGLLAAYFVLVFRKRAAYQNYVLFMYYDRKSKLFTSVTHPDPFRTGSEIELCRFKLSDVRASSDKSHNILFKGKKRVIENQQDFFLNAEVYEMLKKQLSQ